MRAFLFTSIAYVVLPLLTLYSCFDAIYLLDVRDPEFLSYLALWLPGLLLYYIYISQLIIGQRLPFLDQIWGFPNVVRKHRGLFRHLLLITLVLHSGVHLYEDGIEKVLLKPDLGMLVAYAVVVGSIVLMVIASKVWLKKRQKVADYAKMHRLHQLFYLLAVGIWFHVVSAGSFEHNYLGQALVTGYLLFALACKLYLMIAEYTAPIYKIESVEPLHENFVRLRLRAPQNVDRKVRTLNKHKAGQYAYFSFAHEAHEDKRQKKTQKKTHWEQHPFSFAGYATADSVLTIVVKNLGDFTAKLANFPIGAKDAKVRVHGPYGKFHCNEASFSEGVHLIAAGIGITPFISMLEQKAYQVSGSQTPLTLHWFVKEEGELVFGDRFAHFLKRIPNLKIHSYVGKHLADGVLEEILSRPQSSYRQLGVMYCGPEGVVPTLKKVMSKLGIPRRNFHTESFSM